MSKRDLNEYELLYLARSNDEEAFQLLAKQYYPMFQKMLSMLIQQEYGITHREAMQAAHIGLYHAIFYYREDKQMAFHNFVWLCASREINGLIKREAAYAYKGDQVQYSLDRKLKETDGIYLEDVVASSVYNPEKVCGARLFIEEVYKKYPEDTLEGTVFKMRLEGYNLREIAEKCQISSSKAAKVISMIKKEFQKLYHM